MAVTSGGAGPRSASLTVLVAALGYFVDIYDLVLFLVVRVKSLRSLGIAADRVLPEGVFLLNLQMVGMLAGGILWGVLGDRRGRVSVLFGSILLYSVANVLNGFVGSVPEYAVLRFVAGVGLAGELGAGVTLVSEIMSREGRGFGTTIIAGVGLSGAIAAALVGAQFDWRTAYFLGGGMGIALLALRVGLHESGLFAAAAATDLPRGSFFSLFDDGARRARYLGVILVGIPIWCTTSLLVGLSPEMAIGMAMVQAPDPGRAVMMMYIGGSLGDFASGLTSHALRSRKKAVGLFLVVMLAAIVLYFTIGRTSLSAFYACCAALGVGSGYWAVFVTIASEQFGTNLRATAATTVPNFVRGAVVPLTLLFQIAKGPLGVVTAALGLSLVTCAAAAFALVRLEETFGRDLDFYER